MAVNVGMGGGGSMYDPQISPFDSSLFFVGCDLTGLYRSSDGGESWTLLDTRIVEGSDHFSVAFDPTHDGQLVGFHRQLGLRFSSDGGASWSAYAPAFPQLDSSGNPLVVTAAAFSPDGRLLVGTSVGAYRHDGSNWTLAGPIDEVVRFAFVRETTGAVRDLMATVNTLYRWNSSTTVWEVFEPPGAPARPSGEWNGSLGSGTPPTYSASRIRGLAAATAAGNASYAVYLAIMTEAADIATTGGIYRYDSGTGAWTRETSGLDLTPGGASSNIDAPRYERLAMADKQTDIVYVSAIPTGYVPNVYRRAAGGSWTGIYSGYPKRTDANVDPGWFEFPAPQGLGWGFGGLAHGLVADPRDSDRVLYTNEAAVYFADRGTTAALSNPKNWTQRFTRLASGAAGQASDRWQTTGLDVTTVWNYVIHPTNSPTTRPSRPFGRQSRTSTTSPRTLS
jgi:hypothetical protein